MHKTYSNSFWPLFNFLQFYANRNRRTTNQSLSFWSLLFPNYFVSAPSFHQKPPVIAASPFATTLNPSAQHSLIRVDLQKPNVWSQILERLAQFHKSSSPLSYQYSIHPVKTTYMYYSVLKRNVKVVCS